MIPKQLDPSLFFARSRHAARHAAAAPSVLTRRGFIGRVAGGAGAVVGASLLRPGVALAGTQNPAPKPTTQVASINGVDFHVTFFGPGVDPSAITDFRGSVGVAEVQGTGRATNPDGSKETLLYDTDMRFMKGDYIAQDGKLRTGTFGFV
ncbi:MAG: twin-arginine translocation signal domain-containing protein [Actinomycetota bacterium]